MKKLNIKIVPLILIVVFSITVIFANVHINKKEGKISFITSQNIYLRFENTEGITKGDTAYYQRYGNSVPVMVVEYLSSSSCSGRKLSNLKLKVGDKVFIWTSADKIKTEAIDKSGTEKDTNLIETSKSKVFKTKNIKIPEYRSNFYGNLTAYSFSDFANYTNSVSSQRWRYSLNMNAENIGGSHFYFSNYMNFSYLTSQWSDVKSNVFNNLRIYDLSMGYKTKSFSTWIGRHMNSKISNVGPIDGLQLEKTMGNFALGGVVGSRPDFYTLGINSKLFEYGAYINRTDTVDHRIMQNTLAFFQQTNHGVTDRRFLYFQHNNNIFNNLYFFLSSEIDLYKVQNNIPKSDFSLTSLYLVTQYSPFNSLSINLSYDARRSVIYYQTFKSFIDSLFSNELRQGLNLGFFIRPFMGTFINLNGGYSYQKGDLKPSRNFRVSLTQSDIPFLDISATLSFNRIFSNYQNGSIYGITLTKFIPFNLSTISVGYSKLKYDFGSFAANLNQKVVTAQVSTKLVGPIFFNLYYEGEFEGKTTYGRFMSGINYRF